MEKITKNQPPAPDDMVLRLHTILNELEREFVMIRMTFPPSGGKHKNESHDIPFIGILTAHSDRDEIFIETLAKRIKDLIRLLERPRDYITVKRIAAIKQRYFVLVHFNRGSLRRSSPASWNKRSAQFLAGKLLHSTFDKHISFQDLK